MNCIRNDVKGEYRLGLSEKCTTQDCFVAASIASQTGPTCRGIRKTAANSESDVYLVATTDADQLGFR